MVAQRSVTFLYDNLVLQSIPMGYDKSTFSILVILSVLDICVSVKIPYMNTNGVLG